MRKMTLLVLCTLAVQISHALTDKVDGILWYYTVADGVAKVGDGYVAAIPTSTTGSITIPSQLGGYAVDTINKFAFKDCTNLTSVIIPNSVNTMGSRLFKGCTNLVELTLPFIGNQRRDTSPTLHLGHLFTAGDLPLPNDDGLITIWETASSRYDFWVPPSLKSVTITDDTQLGVGNKFGLFKGCKYITNITLPASVATVGATTFADCIGLENIHLPAGITSVGSNAFHNCSGLKSVHIDDLSSWCGISFGEPHSNPLFYARNLYVGDKLATELVISNDVISIGNYAFT